MLPDPLTGYRTVSCSIRCSAPAGCRSRGAEQASSRRGESDLLFFCGGKTLNKVGGQQGMSSRRSRRGGIGKVTMCDPVGRSCGSGHQRQAA